MAIRKSLSAKSHHSDRLKAGKRTNAKGRVRKMLLESLEQRRLLAVGPQLIGIQPNNSELLSGGDVRTESPRELTFRFDDAQLIDPATLAGIRIQSAGGDGTFGLSTAQADFGSLGKANIQLTAVVPGQQFTIDVSNALLPAGSGPAIAATGNTISIALNTNPSSPTTAAGLIQAVNNSPLLIGRIVARLNGGTDTARLGVAIASAYSPIKLSGTQDSVIAPGAAIVGKSPNENEVTLRFAEALKDDNYRIEIFGFDDPNTGVIGLRNLSGDLFRPTLSGTRLDTVNFRLDLGPQIVSVVPQPVVRVNGQLTQQRDTIVVYFDNDKLLVENDGTGRPTNRSVENPAFYQLIFTSDTVRNTDDLVFLPQTVQYNAANNTATLRFATDINDLTGNIGTPQTFRLRIGTRETLPTVPVRSEATATAITDLNTQGAIKLRFTSRQVGEGAGGIQVKFLNSGSGTPIVSATGRVITVDMGKPNLTAAELVDLFRVSSSSSALVSVNFEVGSNPSTVVGNTNLSFSPVTLYGLGSSFDTATDLGVIGSASQPLSSLILSSAIDPESFILDLTGASDDPAHRDLPQNLLGGFEDHVNQRFGPDATDGISTIYYNFRSNYSFDNLGNALINAISLDQMQRAREILSLWSKYVGVQFVETADLGLTIATAALNGLTQILGTQIQNEGLFGVRIDPTFQNSLIIMSATNNFGNNYAESFSRNFAAAVGEVLGLEHAGDLPETTLLRLDPTFLSGSGSLTNPNDALLNANDEKYEPIFPGNQDILHGQYLYRKDGSDIDLYRFEVDFGGQDRVGLLTAETSARRLTNSSSLNTNLELFREIQATASTTLGAGLSLKFEAIMPGSQGNQLQIFFTQTERGDASKPTLMVFPNAISIDLNSTDGVESTVQDVIDAINASPAARSLVKVSLVSGAPSTPVGGNLLTQNPVVLFGGQFELVSQNDDYFSRDSLVRQSLTAGVYYLGVSASGNDDYNAAIEGTGFGGGSQGDYELRVTFRAAVDTTDTIQDLASSSNPAVGFDGDGDGAPGGTYDFWFQTRPLDRVLEFNTGASSSLEGRSVTVVGASGNTTVFEFSSDLAINPGRTRIPYLPTHTAGDLANALAVAIASRGTLGVSAVANGPRLKLSGERSIAIDPQLTIIEIEGKTIFVDKSAGPNADGSLAHPFNNISGTGVANAFAASHAGDIVRIVGNGGADNNLTTITDNFAYEIGAGLLAGSILSDGLTMDIPKGVTTMIDAGAVFKLRRARIGVGSSNLNIDRSGGALQVLGAPLLLDQQSNALRTPTGGIADGSVFFTSWLDETIGFDTYSPKTTPIAGDWGGISFRRDVDTSAGRHDLEDEGIFLQYVNHADIRYGGGTVILNSVQQSVNPIQMLTTRPTVTDNRITRSASAAMSALPNSFEETNFHEPRFQQSGAFTSDYDRVGPEIRRNTLVNNSINGLFIRVNTPSDGSTQTLTVPGRFDDTDIVHVFTENVVVSGAPGGSILDSTVPPADLISTGPTTGGTLLPGTYSYKLTFIDRNGYESMSSNASVSLDLVANQTAISIAGLPSATGDFVERRLYRSQGNGNGPFDLIAALDRATSTYRDIGGILGGTLSRDRLNVSATALAALPTGTLVAGSYNYRIVQFDAGGREGLASNPTTTASLAVAGSVRLDNIPLTSAGNTGRRVYRSSMGGVAPYVLVGELNASATSFTDNGSFSGNTLAAESFGVKRPRLNASLVIDPGLVLKLEAARIEAAFGANIIAEGTDGNPITFTSRLDDSVGAGGTFDTNNDGGANRPSPRDWGGIYMAPTSTLSVDYAVFSYGGGITKLEGTFRGFNVIELHQAEGRIANSLFENNANGFGGQGPGTRFGRLSNEQATIFTRGTQPIIVDNIFRGNSGNALTIDANSMVDDLKQDSGRQTGAADRDPSYLNNRGPLIRNNRFENNGLNGLEIRGDTLTTASVWDDTDIVHVVFDEIFVGNVQHEGGLRLQSAPGESLVVKFDGYGSNFNRNLGAGITANGQLTSATDRVGGMLHILGQPGFPVILTSLFDDTVGAGLRPNGQPQNDTNNDGIGSIPQAADWRGILLDQYSNDRNVVMLLETESFTAAAPGPNGTVDSAQVLGDLASSTTASNENLHLGFVVEGVLSQSADVDTYSFSAAAGTEVWLDVDYTRNNLDLVIELLDGNGSLLARSDNSTAETTDPSLIFVSDLIDRNNVNPLASRTTRVRTTSSGAIKEDGTTNPLDPGMRVRLPGALGARGTYYFRIRSNSTSADAVGAGLTSGAYQVQVRMREQQEFAGSSVNFADIRYTMNGVHLRGLPGESPLIGEAAEDESVRNGQIYSNNGVAVGGGVSNGFFSGSVEHQIGNRPQYVGNLLSTAKGAISVAGNISSGQDVDFYMLEIDQQDLVGSLAGGYASVVFDMDYADGLNRPDTSINIFREETSQFGSQYRLVYSSDSSNIADDQGRPLSITDVEDLSRGSVGTGDAYIGPVALPEGIYLVGVSSAAYQPRAKVLSPFDIKPINSVKRIVDENFLQGVTGATPPAVQNFLPSRNTGATGTLVSKTFDLGAYASADLPGLYVDYTHAGGNFEMFVVDSNGNEFAVASSNDPSLLQVRVGAGSLKIPLNGVQSRNAGGTYLRKDFSGLDGLSIVFRGANTTNIDGLIVGFAERGEAVGLGDEPILLSNGFIFAPSGNPAPPFAPGSVVSTRQFSLVSYSQFFDRPQIAFDYEVFNGQLDVWAIDDATGQQVWLGTTVAANRPPNVTLLTTGSPQSAVLDISFFSGRNQLRVEFRARNDNPSRTTISNAVIQLADGSRVAAGEPNSTYTTVPVSSATVTTGNYQLEIRLGDEFFSSRRFGAPVLTKSFDTNDRLAETITLVAPLGSNLTDGDRFKISDGGRSITFEFSLDASVGLGNVPILFAATDSDFVVARKIRDAINNPGVQSRLAVRAASSGGIQTGTTGRDTRINLHGNAGFETINRGKAAGEVQVIYYEGATDRNAQRDQGQIIIQNSFIREARDYGVWSEPAARLPDPRDANDPFSFFFGAPLQAKPNLVGTQAVRNLLLANDSVQGGLLPGLVVQNNVLEEGGLGGVMVQGETPIWMISPSLVPFFRAAGATDPNAFSADYNPFVNNSGNNPPTSHFGSFIDDGDLLVVDADRTRLKFEFEDLAGGTRGGLVDGSGQVEGNGYAADSTIAWYRDTGGSFYQRLTCTNCTPFATTAYESVQALRDSFLASILVTNGTTHTIRATVAESLLGPDPLAPDSSFSFGYPEYFNRPALYLEGVTNLQWLDVPGGFSNPFDIRQLDLGETPQPHARIVNNTIIGTDGRASFNGETGLNESNDTLKDATQTWQGTAHNPLFYSDVGIIGDGGQNIASNSSTSAGATSNTDVDIYQFKLGIGERAIIDIDSANSGLDSVLQIFDSRGIAQSFVNANGAVLIASDNDAAPGEVLALDPYADFTATSPGVYYAAVSSVGNTTYDPLSFANRRAGSTTGAYQILISARHLQDFVITAQDASAYSAGDTFTIFGVPDIGTSATSGRTFEFVFGLGGPTNPNNIAVNINPDWRFPDVANAIARAVNEGGPGRSRALPNTQVLSNGQFGLASPLPPVHARALGGIAGVLDANFNGLEGDKDLILEQLGAVNVLGSNKVSKRELERQLSGTYYEVNQGLELFTRRLDGFITFTTTTLGGIGTFLNVTSLSNLGIGHDRLSTNPISFTSRGDGASEKFVVINNAAWIDGNNTIIVDPDQNANNNLDQLLPETGILATRGASPTILNNVFFNLQSPVINEESRVNENTLVYAPYGTDNPNIVSKPGKVVVGGSIYQYYEPGIANLRFGTGIETVPTNVPNTSLDSNFDIANSVRLFVNAQAGQYLPAADSPLIDSAIDTLPERSEFAATKSAMGLALSPVVSPAYDLVGQLRADDPAVSPPGGQGQNVFKDRGALDRADFIGPAAILVDPIDNDALGIDQDRSDSVVQLIGGVYPEFRIQLADGNEPANPLRGLGIDDDTVLNSEIANRRLTGASVVVFENGRLLTEGVDYSFSYNATRDEIVLTPLAGIWKNDRVYEISINNKDRFAVLAPSGDQVADGSTFSIVDSSGGQVVYEFDSGYRIQVPQGLSMLIPLAGGAFGGIADGDRFSITRGTITSTFEFDRNGNTLGGNIAIPFQLGDSQAKMNNAVVAAIAAANIGVSPVRLNDGTVFLGTQAGVRLDTTFTTISQPSTTLALKIPDLGPRPGGITEGQTFTVSDGRKTVTFEYDLDGRVSLGNTPLDFSGTSTADEVTSVTLAALINSGLSLSPKIVSPKLIYLGLSPNGSVATNNSLLSLLGVSRSLSDGQTFVVGGNGKTATFEFSTDSVVAAGHILIPISLVDTQSQIADRIATAITAADLGLQPVSVGDGNIAVGGGVASNTIDLTGAPALTLFGKPGIQSSTRLELFGPLILVASPRGAGDLVENGTFTINDGTRTATFEFDSDFSGPSAPGNVTITFNSLSTASSIAAEMVRAIVASGLAISPSNLGNGEVSLGRLQASQVNVGTSKLGLKRGVVSDGETFTISNGTQSVTFEFDNVDLGNGFLLTNTPILFGSSSTADLVVQSMKAVIEGAGLGLTTTVFPGGIIQLNDTPRFVTDTSNAPTLLRSGVPGGANAVAFVQDPSFSGEDMRRAIIQAINRTSNTSLVASSRGANTLFVENAISISSELDSFFLRGVADVAGNLLKPNRINDETAFTILMPGVTLDYGDAPDPLFTTFGRYATQYVNDGARHVIGGAVLLGARISAELDGQPAPNADRDTDDDGVVFGTNLFNPTLLNNGAGVFNRNVFTSVDVTLSSAGFVDGWIDFNADGDWDDPGEQILTSVEFTDRTLTQTFQVTVPSTAPLLSGPTKSFARFRSSSVGALTPNGLAVDGEVEDYAITITPGTPPTAVDDNYFLNEDSSLVTTDADGTITPSFTIDDGFAANDFDPDGGSFGITIVDPPSVGTLLLDNPGNPKGTFTYTPPANFNGVVTFTYRVNDGILNSNNIGTVTLTIREVNDSPVANNDQFVTSEDVVLTLNQSALLQNDSAGPNEAAQTLVVSSVSPVSKFGGTVTLSGGVISYTPPTDYSGPDEFVYTATDNGTTAGIPAPRSASATVFLTVRDKNDAPITVPDSLVTLEDTPVSVATSVLIGNDLPGPANESGQSLQFVRVLPNSTNGGSVTVSNGLVTYNPPADFVGTDTFFYEVEDNGTSEGLPDPQKSIGTVTVSVTGVNDAPRVRTPFGTAVMLEDAAARIVNLSDVFFDPDVFTNNDLLTYQVLSNSKSSLVTPSINGGQLELQLLADQNGLSLIVVQATDKAGQTITDTLTLSVTPVNDAPRLIQALPDLTTDEDAPALQLVLSPTYFFDPDVILNGDLLTFVVISNSNPLLVTPVITGSTLRLNLSADQSGIAVLAIRATDKAGLTITDTFNLVVNPVNDAPVTTADSYIVKQGQTLRTTDPRGLVGGPGDDGVLANDRDPEGTAMTAVLVAAPSFASQFALNSDGTFTYQHDFARGRTTDTFTYRASDGLGQSLVTTVTIQIDAPPPPPHQNPIQALDVNADGFISPIDALLIINFLNTNSSGSIVGLPPPPPYRDVNGDNVISPLDALLIINALNASRSGGEGESIGTSDALAGAFASQDVLGRSHDNTHIGMRKIDMSQVAVYGPLPGSTRSQIFDQMGQASDSSGADLSWVESHPFGGISDLDSPIDLALASLLGDLDGNGEA